MDLDTSIPLLSSENLLAGYLRHQSEFCSVSLLPNGYRIVVRLFSAMRKSEQEHDMHFEDETSIRWCRIHNLYLI